MHHLIALLASLALAGCYLSHERGEPLDAAPRDVGRPRDVEMRAPDAPVSRCCPAWRFDRTVEVDSFTEGTVTPRLVPIEGDLGVVVTGPSDAAGPSGAHLVRYQRDLSFHGRPVAVTTGSFTWGQPASSGDLVAVCWGTDGGNVVRAYRVDGTPIAPQALLDPEPETPCVDAVYSEGEFTFLWLAGIGATARIVGRDGERGAGFSTAAEGVRSASMAPTPGGVAIALLADETHVVEWAAAGRSLTLDRSEHLRIVRTGHEIALVRTVVREGPVSIEVIVLHRLDAASLEPIAGPVDLVTFSPTAPRYAATPGTCAGEVMLGTDRPSLAVIAPGGARFDEHVSGGDPGTLMGDTSVLVLGDDAYVAFSSVAPGELERRVRIERYVCAR
jgi:hypothetical protein